MSMKTVIHTGNIDSTITAHLLGHFKGWNVERYVPTSDYDAHRLVFIRSWEPEEVLNVYAEKFTHPITVLDGCRSKIDPEKLDRSIVFKPYQTHGLAWTALQSFDSVCPELERFVSLIDDFDTNTGRFPESRYLMAFINATVGEHKTQADFYKHLFTGISANLQKYIDRGKHICDTIAPYYKIMREETTWEYAPDCQITNGVCSIEYMDPECLLKLSYSLSKRSICTIGFIPNNLAERPADLDRVLKLQQELKVDGFHDSNFTSFNTPMLDTLPNGPVVELDKSDLILDDSDHLVQEYVRHHLASKRANEIKDNKIFYVNTQFLSNVLVETIMSRTRWCDTLVLWCIRRDGKIRYVEINYDDFRGLEPTDIQIVASGKFLERIHRAKSI